MKMIMKKVSIVYNQPLTQIQGVNYVNNSFVIGGKYFIEKGLLLSKIYSPNTTFDCTTHDHLDLIGSDVGTASYQRERKIRVLLRDLLSSDYLLGACIKMYANYTLNAKKAIKRMADDDSDYLIFQDLESVRAYYKRYKDKKGVKTILILHSSDHPLEQIIPTFPGYYNNKWLRNRAYRKCDEAMGMVDRVVYLSKRAFDNSPVTEDRKTYIFNGVEDINNVCVMPPSVPVRFVCVGSVCYRKGQLNLVEALSLLDKDYLSKLHVTIVGGGNEFEKCQRLVKEKQLEEFVTITGPRNDVADILTKMDVFVLPSEFEGMPMSILEAMRQGLYIMSTNTGGIPEMFDNGYGEIITRDPHELSNAIRRLLDDNVVTKEAKQMSRNRFEADFTLNKMIERYSDLLLSI